MMAETLWKGLGKNNNPGEVLLYVRVYLCVTQVISKLGIPSQSLVLLTRSGPSNDR